MGFLCDGTPTGPSDEPHWLGPPRLTSIITPDPLWRCTRCGCDCDVHEVQFAPQILESNCCGAMPYRIDEDEA